MKTVRIHSKGYIPALKTTGPIFSKTKISDQLYNQLIKQGIVVEVVEDKIEKPTKLLPIHKEVVDEAIVPKTPLLTNEEVEQIKLEVQEEELKEEKVEVLEEVIEETKEEVVEEKIEKPTKLTEDLITIKPRRGRSSKKR